MGGEGIGNGCCGLLSVRLLVATLLIVRLLVAAAAGRECVEVVGFV